MSVETSTTPNTSNCGARQLKNALITNINQLTKSSPGKNQSSPTTPTSHVNGSQSDSVNIINNAKHVPSLLNFNNINSNMLNQPKSPMSTQPKSSLINPREDEEIKVVIS